MHKDDGSVKESNSEKITYVIDTPSTNPELDRLKRWPFAQRIARRKEVV